MIEWKYISLHNGLGHYLKNETSFKFGIFFWGGGNIGRNMFNKQCIFTHFKIYIEIMEFYHSCCHLLKLNSMQILSLIFIVKKKKQSYLFIN